MNTQIRKWRQASQKISKTDWNQPFVPSDWKTSGAGWYLISGRNGIIHVPTTAGEVSSLPGYDAMGRLFAIGYLKGILDAVRK